MNLLAARQYCNETNQGNETHHDDDHHVDTSSG